MPKRQSERVGILGGGQLARMMGEAAIRLGVQIRIYQARDEGPCSAFADVHTGAFDDEDAMAAFLQDCDVVTLDNEWVPLQTVTRRLPPTARLWPSAETMALIRDKIRQKEHAEQMGLPVGPYAACASKDEVLASARRFGFPVLLKRPIQSYDGYGNRTARHAAEALQAYDALADQGVVLVEQFVPFAQELAVIVARRPSGATVSYPVARTSQVDHRCVTVEVPAAVSPEISVAAAALAQRAVVAFDCVGVVGVELFHLRDGRLLLNELAPRPHNTGHYTLDACLTSQFENHLRAILDLPLGDPSLLCPVAVMANVLGQRSGTSSSASLPVALAVPGASLHMYGKYDVRPGRKMGHVTAVGADLGETRARAMAAAEALE